MIFGGIQKLTLLDYPEKTACTLFTLGCNYRCPYCHNSSLVCMEANSQVFDTPEVLNFLKTRQVLLDGVCISGGEPLLHKELAGFLQAVKELGFLVKLDTNGSFPDELKKLVKRGLVDFVAMDIKNSAEKYSRTIGLSEYDFEAVEASVAFLLSDQIPYEFRTTVVRELHTEDDLLAIARWISKAQKYYLQGFIDSENVMQHGLSGYSNDEMQGLLNKVKTVIPHAELRGI